MSDKTKDKVAEKMKKETPLTDKFQIGLSPVTHLRKYFMIYLTLNTHLDLNQTAFRY